MTSTSINLPEGLKKQLENRLERGDYQNASEYIRDALREKLQKETQLRPEEIRRIMKIQERQAEGRQEWLTHEEVMEEEGLE